MNKKLVFITHSAVIAALYVALTFVSAAAGLASGAVQVRLSEILTILPVFTGAAVPGLFVGCILANLMTGCAVWDIVFGSVATLIGAIGTYALKKCKWLAPIPPIIANTLIVPFVLQMVYGLEGSIWYFMLTVGIGEIISCGILGTLFSLSLGKYKKFIKF